MASRFWVGGTGTWDASTTTHWAASTGGAGGQSVPGGADTVTLDASSGGGTVTVNTTVAVTSITMGAFTGTLDFSANNNSVTLTTFSGTGSGVRTLNLGNGTWTITSTSGNPWDIATSTNLTLNANSSTIVFSGNPSTGPMGFVGGGKTYNVLTVNAQSNRGGFQFGSSDTFATVNIAAPNLVYATNGLTQTITTLNVTGGSISNWVGFFSSNISNVTTISIAAGTVTLDYCVFRQMTFSGGATFNGTNSVNMGRNTGVTITAPSGGGGVVGG